MVTGVWCLFGGRSPTSTAISSKQLAKRRPVNGPFHSRMRHLCCLPVNGDTSTPYGNGLVRSGKMLTLSFPVTMDNRFIGQSFTSGSVASVTQQEFRHSDHMTCGMLRHPFLSMLVCRYRPLRSFWDIPHQQPPVVSMRMRCVLSR